jgi:hypothetical protein
MKNTFGLILLLGGAVLIVIGALSATNAVALVLLGLVTAALGVSGMNSPKRIRHRGRIRPLRRTLFSSRRSPSTHITSP